MGGIDSLVRVGIVDNVKKSDYTVRVHYPGMGNMVSDWLKVLQQPNAKTSYSGLHSHGGEVGSDGNHRHDVEPWLPEVNDQVVVLMQYGFNSTGFVLGVIP